MPPPLLPKSLLLKGAIRKAEEQEAFWKSAAVAPRGPGLLKGSVHTLCWEVGVSAPQLEPPGWEALGCQQRAICPPACNLQACLPGFGDQ